MRTRSPWNLHCEGKGLRVFRSPVVNLPGPWMITRTGTSLWLKCIFQIPRFDTDKSLALGFMRDRQLRDPLLPSRFRGVRLAFSKRLDYSLGRPLGLEQLFYGANIVLSVPMNRLSSSLSLKETIQNDADGRQDGLMSSACSFWQPFFYGQPPLGFHAAEPPPDD